jgi:hypothetical protein
MERAKSKIEAGVREIDSWMSCNALKLNRDQTELFILNAHHRPQPPLNSVSVCNE